VGYIHFYWMHVAVLDNIA